MRSPSRRHWAPALWTLLLAAAGCTDLISSGDISGNVTKTGTGGGTSTSTSPTGGTGGTTAGTGGSTGGTGGNTGGTGSSTGGIGGSTGGSTGGIGGSTGGTGGSTGGTGGSTGGTGGSTGVCDAIATDTTNTSCATAVPITLDKPNGVTVVTRDGCTAGSPSNAEPAPACGGGAGPERVYAVTVMGGPGFWTARLDPAGTNFDSILYVRDANGCSDPVGSLVCEDLPGQYGFGGEVTSVYLPMQPTLYVFVDGKTPADQGQYRIIFEFWSGYTCEADNPINIPLVPGQQKVTLLGGILPLPAGSTGNIECSDGLGAGTKDVAYRFPAVNKKITVVPWNNPNYQPYLFTDAACSTQVPAAQCFQAPPLSVTTQDPFVWVDGQASSGSKTFKMTVETF